MKQDLTIDAALRRIDQLENSQLASSGAWTPHQIFSHCAQSIEYSMAGFPLQKPVLFQRTAGTAAFAVFSAMGRMKHGLNAPIAGAPACAPDGTTEQGLHRLRAAFLAFRNATGPLAPHFVYGALTRAQYEAAHVMHFLNHLDEIRAVERV